MLIRKILHFLFSPSNRRRHPRVYDNPIDLRIQNSRYQTADWSVSGFRILNFASKETVGEMIRGTRARDSGRGNANFVAEIMWRSRLNEIGARYVELNGVPI